MSYVLTLVAARDATTLDAATIARLRDAVKGTDIVILSPDEAADIVCPAAPEMAQVRAALGGAAIDAVAQPAAGRRKSLLLADMDSTIVTSETLDELAERAGVKAQVADITARSMNGEIDFAAALRERVAMLRGLRLEALDETWRHTRLTGGAKTLVATMRAHGAYTALVSGGFTFFTDKVARLCGFDAHRANTLLHENGRLTGMVADPILGREAKLAVLRTLSVQRGIGPADILAVGDGANDLAMLDAAGLGIAFHAKPSVAAAARHLVMHADLRALLFLQGYADREFVSDLDTDLFDS